MQSAIAALPADRLRPGGAALGASALMDDPVGEISVYLAGRLLGERYRLESHLATGGMAQVWRALDLVLRRPVAVKVLLGERIGDPASLARFRAEAQLAAGLSHANVAGLYDYGEFLPAAGHPGERLAYLVMELVDGEPLSTVLRRERPLAPGRTLEILRQAAAGLAAAHAAGIVHRDVKPGNLLIGPAGEVKITDFGIARTESSEPMTGPGEVMGTAQYLSPEQARGAVATATSDVYALGVVAYECLAGRRPFEGGNPVQTAIMRLSVAPEPLPPHIPAGVRRLVERAMTTDPAFRFPDGAALLDAVAGLMAGAAGAPRPNRDATTVQPVADLDAADLAPVCGAAPRVPDGFPTPRAPRHAAPRGRGPSRVRSVLTALILLVALGVTVAMFRSPDPAPASAARPSPTTAPVSTIGVRAADHVGRPVAEVRVELAGLGLTVRLRALPTADVPAGEVTALDPVGHLVAGQVVTVTYAVAPPAPSPAPTDGATGEDAPGSAGGGGAAEAEAGAGDETQGNRGRGNGEPASGRDKKDDKGDD